MNLLIPASLVLAGMAAVAYGADLSVTDLVMDKLGACLPQAKVCLVSDPAKCATTGPTGAFRFTTKTPIAIRVRAEAKAPKVEWRQGRLRLIAVERAPARVTWLDGMGRSLGPTQNMELVAGANTVAPPAAARGLVFMRVDMPAAAYTWKAALMGAHADLTPAADSRPAVHALARVAAVAVNRDLSVAKASFRRTYYRPVKDTVENVNVALAPTNDSGTVFSGGSKAKVISIDSIAKSVRHESAGRKCDYEKPVWVPDSARDTSSYAVRNVKLYRWDNGMCKGDVYSGGTSVVDPIGSWTQDESASLPSDLSATGCTEPAAGLPSDAWRKRTLVVTETVLQEGTEFEAGTGNMFIVLVRFRMGEDSAAALVMNTSKEGAVKEKAGDIASLTYGLKKDSIAVEVKYKRKTCAGTKYFGPEQECPDSFMALFMACLAGMGFAGPGREGPL